MPNPQQPELARNRKVPPLAPDATETALTGQPDLPVDRARGAIPEDNLPGHHPDHEQDKPDPAKFLAKMHALAEEQQAEAEVEVDVRDEERPDSDRAERIAAVVTTPLRETAKVLGKLREKL